MMIPLGATELLVAAVVFFVSYYFIKAYDKKKRLPPGPWGLPILGHLPFLKKDPHVQLRNLASKYGDIFSLYMGNQLIVVLNGADAIKEGMNKTEFLARPSQGAFTFHADIPSILTVSGKAFQEQRRFMLYSMKDLGFGKTVLEECMKDEMVHFLRVLDKWKGQPYEVKTALVSSMVNNIISLVYGIRYNYDDPRMELLERNRQTVSDFLGQTAIHVFFPWIINLPFMNKIFGYDRAMEAANFLVDFVRKHVEEHRKTLDPNHTRDYIDKFLLEMQSIKEKKVTGSSFTENMLIGNSGALMGAGSETVQVTVDWSLYITAAYPDVQKRVQEEIDSIVGSERMPSYSDHKLMPYTQAVIMEIMRWKSVAPLNVLRCTLEDTTFKGYYIPKNTMILANLWSSHNDTKYFDIPEVFEPERFLSPDGKSTIRPEAFMPFSTGKRSCPGESMAVMEVFIYFTTILQRFDVSLPKGDIPDFDGILTITYRPKPHKLCFTPRSSS